jgi:hypothetical protein
MLEEDLQIVRATLATITGDVREFSHHAAEAIQQAVEKIDHAQYEFAHADDA